MRYLPGFLLAVLCATPAAGADLFAFESGRGNHNSRGSDAWFLRYQRDMLPLWKTTGFIELSGGAWDGDVKNRALGAGLGLRYMLTTRAYASVAGGLAYVTDRTRNLGTHAQFHWRFAVGWRSRHMDIALAQIHYSNGKSIFNWEHPNVGDNFLTLQVGYRP